MSLAEFPITEDTNAVLVQFAIFDIAGRAYQGIVLCDPNTGDPVGVDSGGNLAIKQAKGTKTFSDPAPTTVASLVLAANNNRISALIQNMATGADVYLGKDNTVTTSTGILLGKGTSLEDMDSHDAWWAITASGTADLRVCEVA